MRTSKDGIDLIKRFEGLRLVAYLDTKQGKVWTIGYGHTDSVTPDMVITEEEAEDLLADDLAWAEAAVSRRVGNAVSLLQCQYDALVSFVFNLGAANFGQSTLLKRVRAGEHNMVPMELTRWIYDEGVALKGLARRRVAEAALYLRD